MYILVKYRIYFFKGKKEKIMKEKKLGLMKKVRVYDNK